jgi:general transcription factor 3C polypeptide 4
MKFKIHGLTNIATKPILVAAKPGVIHLHASPISTLPGWTGALVLPLQTQRSSAGSSILHPVCGIQYVRSSDTVIIGLYDGSFYSVRNLSSGPLLSTSRGKNTAVDLTSSQALSTLVRSIFLETEPEYTRFTDINRTSGFVSYDGSSTMMWAHE